MQFAVRFTSLVGPSLVGPALLAIVAGLGGCSLVRAPIVDPGFDGGGLDAPLSDVPGLDAPDAPNDAPLPDVPGLDAPDAPIDGGTDAGMPDAGCVPADEACNGRDDDCNGAIDEGNACRACSEPGTCVDCVGFEAGGRVYQSCPALPGYRYWARICATLGDRYDLAVPNDVAENDAIAAQLRTVPGINAYHWIGVNDFETNGTYVAVDGASIDAAPRLAATGGTHDWEGGVILQSSGNWEDWPLDTSHRALCELDPTARLCTSSVDVDDTCDQVDDDCDGFWDEDCDGPASCTSHVFWDSVYYVCADDMNSEEAKAACIDMDATLAVLDHRFELQVADDFTGADAWVGLAQDAGGTEPGGGWRWGGVPWMSSDADWGAMWDGGNPSSAADEDCGFIKDSSARLQDHDCTMNRTASICEAPL